MNFKVCGLLCITILFFACSQPSVVLSSEKMLESGYSTFKTYAFLPTTDTQYAKMINRQELVPVLVAEAREQLDKKGFVLDTLHPDCLFTYHLVMNRQYAASQDEHVVYNQQVHTAADVPLSSTSGSSISGASYMRAGTAPGSNIYYFSSDNRPYTYDGKIRIDTLREGSMVIDMIDAKSRRVVWRSVAQGKTLESQKLTPTEAVKYYIPEMLKKLPRK